MIRITEVDVSEALDLSPLDLLLCENCEFEIPIAPEATGEIICPKCHKVMDKSLFSPVVRKQRLWVSEKGLKLRVQRRGEPAHCNCMEHYRRAIHFRHTILNVYEKQGKITEAQAVGMLVAFYTGFDKGVLRLLGKDAEAVNTRLRQGGSFYASLEKLGKDEESDRNEPDKDFLWEWLANMQVRERRLGRRARSDTRVLIMNAVVLMFCPNAYLHFLEDALRLRAEEYSVKRNHARVHMQRWDKFWLAKRAVETSCKRIWRSVYGRNPEPPQPPSKCEYWWERVAQQQGLMG